MTKYVLEVQKGQANTAGVKAKEDITNILVKEGFKKLLFKVRNNRVSKLFLTGSDWKKSLEKVIDGDMVVLQYPMYSRFAGKSFFKAVDNKTLNINKVVIIHDIESLRLYKDNSKAVEEELNFLNKFDCLIVHNNKMKTWLQQNGVTKKMVDLEIFDYLNDNKIIDASIEKPLIFAGNLEKSKFLENLNIRKKVNLFGIKPSETYPDNISYNGVKNPEELSLFLDGSFGLVWDGDSLKTNNGVYGEYTRYNNPHKVSLYLSSGLPVIMWEEAALAQYVLDNKVGIVINSLENLDNVLNGISENEYYEMKSNVVRLSEKMRTGYYTKNAVNLAMSK